MYQMIIYLESPSSAISIDLPKSTTGNRIVFCCTILGVTSTRRYLASCPMKPGLSSPV